MNLKEKIIFLLPLLAKVESNNNPSCIGDNGNAVGVLQIWKIVIDDVNRILKQTKFTYADRSDPVKSFEIAKVYLNHYCKEDSTYEIISRRWNGGPKGDQKIATLKYWEKVKQEIKNYSLKTFKT
jgi:hypothetical protein